jgi:hypothetical protein
MDRALASSGLLVVAIDMTVAPDTPYPACVQDANYGVRWLKANAPKWNGDTFKIGIYGSSSGGHVAELIAMRPHDPRYSAIPLEAAANLDATVAFIATRSPISNTVARYENAEKRNRAGMTKNNKTFFNPRETIQESNPQKFLDREEKITFRAVPHRAGRARRQHAAGGAGTIRQELPGRGRQHRVPSVRNAWSGVAPPRRSPQRQPRRSCCA